MPHVKGRPKAIWTGDLPEGAVEGSPDDDRICWHVSVPWGELAHLQQDLLTLAQAEWHEQRLTEREEDEQAAVWAIITRYVAGWSNYVDQTGEAVPFTLEEFTRIDTAHVQALFERIYSLGTQIRGK